MRSALTILAGACCASLALAQPAPRTETRTSTTASFHRFSTVVGTTFTVGTDAVGKVADVVYDDGGCIEYMLVQDTDGFIVVPWSVVTVNYDRKTVTVQSSRITVDKLREARFAEGRLNFGDPAFRQKMTSVYGAAAGRSRSDRTAPGTTTPDRTTPGKTAPDRKGGTTPPDRTSPDRTVPKGGTTPPATEKPGTTTPPGKGEPPAKETPRKEPKKDKDKDGK